ncbi:hypothetical protein PXH69_33580 [Rhodococcus qingshengii]|uniref:Uncharacterized protein n=1 Tax=Rhodococcus qingshengii TaxID=334542 RepID=A0AAW6LTP7_RHOSG|nr:hypothetical protein [Rhodococcus qingshengii]MDE8649899.1 hypothetical protein [Rhodococcus qingshengii]
MNYLWREHIDCRFPELTNPAARVIIWAHIALHHEWIAKQLSTWPPSPPLPNASATIITSMYPNRPYYAIEQQHSPKKVRRESRQ